MMDWLLSLVPNLVTGLVAAGAAWGAISVKLAYMSRDIARLDERLDGMQNLKSVANVLQNHESRLVVLETLERNS